MRVMANQLDLQVVTQSTLESGLEMGVLSDGTVFLSGRGLARACGVAESAVRDLAANYRADSVKPRDRKVAVALAQQGHSGPLYTQIDVAGAKTNAFPEAVCMAVLEYYAFDANQAGQHIAQGHFRVFARAGLRTFVYRETGYLEASKVDPFASFYQRLLLNKAPAGYFSVLSEMSRMVLESIRAGLPVDPNTVPDISVGIAWSKYWKDRSLEAHHGQRHKHPHVYPDDYPQADANPHAWVYPLSALGIFVGWIDAEYLPNKFPAYIQRKVRKGVITPTRADLLIQTLAPAALPGE